MKLNRLILNTILSSLIGIALCLVLKAYNMLTDVQSNTVFVAELEKEILPGQKITIESLMNDNVMIKKGSIELITAQEANETMIQEMPEIEYMADNPFRDIILFKMTEASIQERERLINELEDIRGIENVYHDEELLATMPNSIKSIRLGMLLVASLVLLGSIIALVLRIKRDLKARKEEIRIMSLAGAEESYIMDLRRSWSVKWGIITALFASAITAINILLMNETLFNDLEITFLHGLLTILAMMVCVTLIHGLTTHLTIKNYLSQLNPNIKT